MITLTPAPDHWLARDERGYWVGTVQKFDHQFIVTPRNGREAVCDSLQKAAEWLEQLEARRPA